MLDEEQNPLVRVHGLCFRLRDAEHLVVEALPRLSLALGKKAQGIRGQGLQAENEAAPASVPAGTPCKKSLFYSKKGPLQKGDST